VRTRPRPPKVYALGNEQRSFFAESQFQIFADDGTDTVGQNHTAQPSSLFCDPQQPAGEIDMFDIDGGQGGGSKAQGAQQHDDNQISQTHG